MQERSDLSGVCPWAVQHIASPMQIALSCRFKSPGEGNEAESVDDDIDDPELIS